MPAKKAKTLLSDRADDMKWLEIVVSIAVLIILYPLFSSLESFLQSSQIMRNEGVHLGGMIAIGFLASFFSCFALVGGLLLSIAAAWREESENKTPLWRLHPFLMFALGRVCGYFLFGGLVGLAGERLALSLHTSGIVTILIAIIMVVLGLKILRIRGPRFCRLPANNPLMRVLRSLSASHHPIAAALLGALTFFIPCGFTQSAQLLALGSGSFMSGALIMTAFALGSLPSLLGISMVSAYSRGTFGRLFLRFSGVLVIAIGIATMNNGLTLAGVQTTNILHWNAHVSSRNSDNVTIDGNGQQIIHLTVTDRGYVPSEVTIEAHRPTWVYAYSPTDPVGCTSLLTAPAFGIVVPLSRGYTWLGPIENPTENFVLTCSIGRWKANVYVKA